MLLVSPDLLKDCLQPTPLSLATLLLGLVIGVLLWLMGSWGHRFVIVLLTTLKVVGAKVISVPVPASCDSSGPYPEAITDPIVSVTPLLVTLMVCEDVS